MNIRRAGGCRAVWSGSRSAGSASRWPPWRWPAASCRSTVRRSRPAGADAGPGRLAEPGRSAAAGRYRVRLTRAGPTPDLAARSPARRLAALELAGLVGYVAVAMAGGRRARPGGSATTRSACTCPVRCTASATRPRWLDLLVGGVQRHRVRARAVPRVPRPRLHPGATQPALSDRRADLRLILVILVVETVLELATLGGPLR